MSAFHIINFGCRATQADGAAIERELLEGGHVRTSESDASWVVLNTCTVTAAADADARAAVRRVHRENPGAKILVTGCYAQRAPEELAALPGVHWVVGNSHKSQIASLLGGGCATTQMLPQQRESEEAAEAGAVSALLTLDQIAPAEEAMPAGVPRASLLVGDIFAHTEVLAAPIFEGEGAASGFTRTRANLKVQDGCNNRCSFCIIPFVRGRSRSLALGKVVAEAEQLVRVGFKELVLSGINLGRWGRDFTAAERERFPDLLRTLLARTQVEKLRISSVEPMDWSDELIALMATEPRIAKHAHLPLQSGSDRILRKMHRKYRPWHYEDRITRIRVAMSDAAIGADVMVGFPGEREPEFQETYDFIARLPFTYLHVFTFSARPGTAAAEMAGQVPVHVARERNRVLRTLIADKNAAFRASFVGRSLRAITLSRGSEGGATEALTDNFVKLEIAGDHAANRWMDVAITGLSDPGLVGEAA